MERWGRSCRAFVIVSLALAWLAMPAEAQEYVLDLSLAPTAKLITLQVPDSGGAIPLTLMKAGTTTVESVTIGVTPFLSDTGERLATGLSTDGSSHTPAPQITLTASAAALLRCNLVVPALSTSGPYTGNVFISIGAAAPVRHTVAITASGPSRPATLQTAPASDTRSFTIKSTHVLWTPKDETAPATLDLSLGPTFDIRFGDAAGRWPIQDVTVGPVGVAKAPDGFGVSDHLAFYNANGTKLRIPFTVPRSGMTVRMQLVVPRAGEYTATVPFHGANAGLEPRPFTLTVHAKHPVLYAVLCLSAALLLSYAASKLLAIRGERVRLIERIQALRPDWLRAEPQTVAVVWVQSIVNQAGQLSSKWLLPSLEDIHRRLDTAQALLVTIDRLRRVRQQIQQSALPHLARARALKIANRIGNRLDPDVDQAALAEETTAIVELRGWTRAGESVTHYSNDLSQAVGQLLANVDLKAIPADAQDAVNALITELKLPLPTTVPELEIRERKYATLKIFWERHANDEFKDLLALHAGPLEQLFRKADDTAWARLNKHSKGLRLQMPSHPDGRRPEALDPLTFLFATGVPGLDATFLVQQGLLYQWRFELVGKKGATNTLTLSPSTRGPRVPQYAAFAGTLTPRVTLTYGNEVVDVAGDPVTVEPSRRFAAVNGFSAAEVLQLLLAFVVAVITGLQTFYYKAGGFGVLPDYLTLFAWGATIDQMKNFLQRLPAATATTRTVTAPAITAGATSTPPIATPTIPAAPAPAPEIPAPVTPPALNLDQ